MTTLESLVAAFNGLTAALEFIAMAMVVISLFSLALWRQVYPIFIISGLCALFIGLSWANSHSSMSYVFLIISAYQFLKGVSLVLAENTPSRGISQFKGIINKMKSWF